MRSSFALLLALALALGVAAPAARAQMEDSAELPEETDPADATDSAEGSTEAVDSARAHFRLGVDFYRERNFRAALIEFKRAYSDAPHYKLLYNLGQASLELQEYAGAIDYLNDYLEQGGDEIPPARRQEVEDAIRYLESRIAHVSISSNREGADVYVDDTLVGRTPLSEPLRVGAGRHKFTAIKQGLPQVERTFDIAAQERREVRLDFVERQLVAPAANAEQPTAEPGREGGAGNTAALVSGVTTAALGAGAITMTVLAMLAQQAYDDELESETTRAKLGELRDDAEAKALVTDIFWAATLVSGIVTTVLIVSNDGEDQSPAQAASRIEVGIGPAAIVVDGRF